MTVPLDSLAPLGTGADFVVVSDDRAVCEELSRRGLPTREWTEDLVMEDGARVLLALCHKLVSRSIRKQFSPARVLVLPIASFDDSYESILYTVEMAFATDYVESCRRNHEWIGILRNKPDGVLRFVGPTTDLECRLRDDLKVHTSLKLEIEPGEWVSVADYCEVSLQAPSRGNWLGAFSITGYAEAVGVLSAEDSRVVPVGIERVQAARPLRSDLVENGPVALVLDESVLQSATVAGRDRSKEIGEVTNPEYGLHAIELGLGSNPAIASLVDWGVNSQLNEGVGLVHLGFGEGITGAHMDFVIDQVVLV
jgi:hypothetical protein